MGRGLTGRRCCSLLSRAADDGVATAALLLRATCCLLMAACCLLVVVGTVAAGKAPSCAATALGWRHDASGAVQASTVMLTSRSRVGRHDEAFVVLHRRHTVLNGLGDDWVPTGRGQKPSK